jgi:hypothetical protein
MKTFESHKAHTGSLVLKCYKAKTLLNKTPVGGVYLNTWCLMNNFIPLQMPSMFSSICLGYLPNGQLDILYTNCFNVMLYECLHKKIFLSKL